MLTNQKHVMTFMWLVDDKATFAYGNEDDPSFFSMAREPWEDMDSPRVITVIVMPGDLLNGE